MGISWSFLKKDILMEMNVYLQLTSVFELLVY